jgi:16S rRNA (guanine527-N7)-methyltransferase
VSLDILASGATRFGIGLHEEQLAAFATYCDMLLDWNRRLNLTGIVDRDEIAVRHFLDALSCFLVVDPVAPGRLIDVGTGAGLPGLALKIAAPPLALTLVESVAKKTQFLAAVVGTLGLRDVSIQTERAETLGQQPAFRARYDWAVARSVARLPTLLEYLLPLVRVGGHALALKGASAAEEVAQARKAVETLGGEEPYLTEVTLPGHDKAHFLVTVRKRADTPSRYPRRPGVPARRPL